MRAVVYSVLAYAGEQPTVERVEQAASVATRLPDEWAMLLIQLLYKSAPNVVLKVPSWQPLWQRLGKYIGNLTG
jgi:hypothetical protein